MSIMARWVRWVVPAAVAVVVLALASPPAQAADAAPDRATVFTHAAVANRTVTLTMDADWYTPGDVPTVLRILRENGITAGFGLTGRYVERYPEQARAIVAAGHKLINHSYDHPYFSGLSRAQRWAQLDRAEAAFRGIGAGSSGWFRAPYRDGYLDPGLNADLAARGYYISFDWTYDTTGYQGASTATILDRVRRLTVPGATVLMHLSSDSTDTAALPQVIATLRSMGYGFTDPYRAVTLGAIGGQYAALGGRSFLGAPRTPEMVAAGPGTAVQWFDIGRIYWRPETGAHEVYGAILGKYAAFGTGWSFLGFPVTGETSTPDRVGRYNHFQYGGSIYWTPATGAHEVHGWIRVKWESLGWERGFLGYPLSDEVAVTGGRASQFQGGNVYWSPATGSHEVHGAILARYVQLGGSGSRLGLPTSDEYAVSGGRRSDFTGGSLTWNATTGAVTEIHP